MEKIPKIMEQIKEFVNIGNKNQYIYNVSNKIDVKEAAYEYKEQLIKKQTKQIIIDELNLTDGIKNSLKRAGFNNLNDLICNGRNFRYISGIGPYKNSLIKTAINNKKQEIEKSIKFKFNTDDDENKKVLQAIWRDLERKDIQKLARANLDKIQEIKTIYEELKFFSSFKHIKWLTVGKEKRNQIIDKFETFKKTVEEINKETQSLSLVIENINALAENMFLKDFDKNYFKYYNYLKEQCPQLIDEKDKRNTDDYYEKLFRNNSEEKAESIKFPYNLNDPNCPKVDIGTERINLDSIFDERNPLKKNNPFIPDDKATEYITHLKQLQHDVENIELNLNGMDCVLRSYQEYGTKFIIKQKAVLLGDEMGLGKTIQALAAMVHLYNDGYKHFVVIAPAAVITNWQREIKKFTKFTFI